MTSGSGCCYRGPHGKRSGSQHSMMHRSRVVATHAKQILNDALNVQEAPRVVGAKLLAPLPNRLVRRENTSFSQRIVDIPEATAKTMAKPDAVTDNRPRKTVCSVLLLAAELDARVDVATTGQLLEERL